MLRNPKILYVTTALHAPPHGGCMIRTANICRQLKKFADLTMLAVTPNFVAESVELCRQEFQPFYKVDIRSYNAFSQPWGDWLKKWHMHNPFTEGLQAAEEDRRLFRQLVKTHDIVWFHTLPAAQFLRCKALSKSVMDLDDLRDCYYQQYAEKTANLRWKCSAWVQAYKWKRHQHEALKRLSRVVVCSDEDKQYLGGAEKIRIIPNGYPALPVVPKWVEPDPDRIGFIGLLHYDPNRDGLLWFREKVWPLIRKNHPDVTLRIIGQRPSPDKYVSGDGFEYLGFLPDTTDEMKTWSALIVPITYGGGTRIKILDAFSKMIPVVSTPIGAHGIQAEHDRQLLIADDPHAFAAHCVELLDTPKKGQALAKEGWKLFESTYSWDVIGNSLKTIIDELMG